MVKIVLKMIRNDSKASIQEENARKYRNFRERERVKLRVESKR